MAVVLRRAGRGARTGVLVAGFGLLGLGESRSAQAAEPPAPPPSESARRQYEASFVEIEATRIGGYGVRSVAGGAPAYVLPSDTWEAYQGRDRLKLGLLEFYDAVDRPDLRSDAVTHYVLQTSFGLAGFGLVLGGGIYEAVHLSREPSSAPVGGWIVMGAGVACLITAYVLGPRPIPADQAVTLANQHNSRIRLQLGLPPTLDGSTERGASLRLARGASSLPTILGIQGLSLALRF